MYDNFLFDVEHFMSRVITEWPAVLPEWPAVLSEWPQVAAPVAAALLQHVL